MPASDENGDLEFTGERFIPGMGGQIAMEHVHRYLFAAKMCRGKRVLDAACGEGYGSAILSSHGASVVGVDVAESAVSHARKTYDGPGLEFVCADVTSLPFERHEFDMVVSYETIEHHDRHEEMMAEVKRVLKPGGILVISSPDKLNYSIKPQYKNPFHVKELLLEEFVSLVGKYFGVMQLYGQRVAHGSLLVSSQGSALGFESYRQTERGGLESSAALNGPLYDIIVASDEDFDPPTNMFYEQEIHGMPAAEFYSQHVMEKLNIVERKLNAEGERDATLVNSIVLGIHSPLSEGFDAIKESVSECGKTIARLSEDVMGLQSGQKDAKNDFASFFRLLEAKDAELRMSGQALEEARAQSDSRQARVAALTQSIVELEAKLERLGNAFAQDGQRFAESEKRLLDALSFAESEKSRLEVADVESMRKLSGLVDSLKAMEAQLAEKTIELDKANSENKLNEGRLRILRNSFWWRIGRLDRLFQG